MKKYILILLSILISNVAIASSVNINYDDGIYHIILSGKKLAKQLNFVSNSGLITNKEAHLRGNAILTINAGFFDPNNQKTISYIVNDYQIVDDPMLNDALTQSPVLRRGMRQILNRTEFRVLNCDDKFKFEIAPHNSKIDFMCSVKTSAQGGPQLLPTMRLEEEFFIVKDEEGNVIRESASVLHKTPRTLIGLKNISDKLQEVHIFIVTDKHPMTIYEARDLCASYHLDSAMAFDGGSSTSLDYKKIHVVSTQDNGDTGRALKSFMLLNKK